MRSTWTFVATAALAVCWPTCSSAGESPDVQAAQEIAGFLRDSGQLKNYSIGVKFKDGTAWLSGRVTSEQQLTAALDVVNDIEGVNKVVNNIAVDAPAAATTEAAALSQLASRPAAVQLAAVEQANESQLRLRAPAAEGLPAGYSRLQGQPRPMAMSGSGRPIPAYVPGTGGGVAPASFDQPHMPNHAWPSYAAYPNYAAVTYPKQYSPTAWPFIGPFYPYPQVPLGWRKVSLEWDDGWWFLDFDDRGRR